MREESAVDTVCNYIRRQIIEKKIFPGNRILEGDVAEKTGVSRISVRSAFAKLENEGLLENMPNRSACLISPSEDEMRNIYRLRLILELEAARSALEKITDEALDRMEAIVEKQRNRSRPYVFSEAVKDNYNFHWEYIKAADNAYLEKFLNEILNRCTIYLLYFDKTKKDESIDTHSKIIKAFRNKDRAALEDAIREGIIYF